MLKRNVNVKCIQEARWANDRSGEITKLGFKIWYIGKNEYRIIVSIIVDKDHKDKLLWTLGKG